MKRRGKRHCGRRARRGFTLVEVMLATTLLAMMASLVWASFSLTVSSRRKAAEISERYHQARLALTRMTREISMAFLSKNDEAGAVVPRTLFVAERESDIDELTFTSLSHVRLQEDAKESDQTTLRYFAAPDREDSSLTNLMRRASRRIGGEKPGEEGPAYIMLERVVELHYEFFDPVADDWREEWNTRSADGQPDRLPTKVRIELTILDHRDEPLTLRTATRVFLQDPLWFSTQ